MPRYRISYVLFENEPPGAEGDSNPSWMPRFNARQFMHRTEMEDVVEARDPSQALEVFFENHVEGREHVQIVGEDGRRRPIPGIDDFDPMLPYVWVEDSAWGRYTRLTEMTPGLTTCPLCTGSGEIDAGLAEYYEEARRYQN